MDFPHDRYVGNYILGAKIGSGAFSVVWRARHRFTDREVAVKEIDKKLLSHKLFDNLLKEISILSTINHPNIIRLLDSIQTDAKIFLVLEYCRGGDLAAYIHRHGKVSEVVARHFMRQLALGLQVLQQKHFIHRDLKPQNLLLSSDGATPNLKIGDFGFARSVTPQDLADTLCGSPLYMAPEIILNQKYDAKADLWSVGVILFQLVTGKLPFHGNTQNQLFQNILASRELQFPNGALEDLHPNCVDLCRTLLRNNPVERLSYVEFFNHKFLEEPRLMMDSLTQELKSVVQQLDSSASDKRSQLHPEHLICSAKANAKLTSSSPHDIVVHENVHGGTSGNRSSPGPMPDTEHDRMRKPIDGSQWLSVGDSLKSIEKDYVLVNRHFASTDNFFCYSETLLQGYSAAPAGVSVYQPKKNDQDVAVIAQTDANAANPVICRPDSLSTTSAPPISREVQGESTLHPSTRLRVLRQFVEAVGELALEKQNAGEYLESFSVELVVLAIWKKILGICSSWLASTSGGESREGSSAVESTCAFELDDPSSASKWGKQEFLAAYDRVENLSSHIRKMDAAAEMPDAMEMIFQRALKFGKSGAVDEYMANKDAATSLYYKATLLLAFIIDEAPSLPLTPPFVLTPSNKKRIETYINTMQSHQSHF